MLRALTPHAQTADRRTVLYAGFVLSAFLAAFWFSLHGRLQVGNSVPTQHATSALPSQIRPRLLAGYGKIPLSFEANKGQANARVKFLSRGRGYGLFLASNEAVLELQEPAARIQDSGSRIQGSIDKPKSKIQNQFLRLRLEGAKPSAEANGSDELPGKVNYFIGNDPKKWRTNVPTYAKVRYRNVYPGVDLEYYGNQGGQLEYDFIVAPGADPSAIALHVGADREPPLRIDANGDLVIPAKGGEVRFHKPRVFQFGTGASLVDARFDLDAQNRIRFAIGYYDHSKPLVIDPVLVYSTCLGGPNDAANGVALDSSGNTYVTGTTTSDSFPTVNPFQATNKSQSGTVFVTKFNATGTALVYSTYLGGSGGDTGNAIAVDSAGSAYLTGQTCSSDFPTALPLLASLKGSCDPFVTKLNPAATSLVYSTYLGGSGSGNDFDYGAGIAVDSSGNAYVTGATWSSDFPTVNALQPSLKGYENNAFVSKLNSSGSALVYSTYLGGSDWNNGAGIAVDSSGSAYLTGATSSPDFPTVNPFQTYQSKYGAYNAFVAKLNPGGSALVYSTFLGGSGLPNPPPVPPTGGDGGHGIAVDSSGNAYLTGATWSPDFPTVNPIQTYQSKSSTSNAFVSKLNSAGSALIYSTYLGGSGCTYDLGTYMACGDRGVGIAIDSSGVAYVAGTTASRDFPTVNAIQATNNDHLTSLPVLPYTGFVACLNAAGSALAYSTYLGGNYQAQANAIAVDSSGNAHVGGGSGAGFPTVNPIQANNNGAFVVMISPPPAVTLLPTSLDFGTVLGGTTSPEKSVNLTPLSSASVSLSSIVASGDFALVTTSTSCPYSGGTLAAGAGCTIDITFTPKATDTRSGTVTITYSGLGSPQTIALSGVGMVAAANLSPASLTFGNQDEGNPSSPQAVMLTNPNAVPLAVSSIAVSSGWTESNNCIPAVPANSSCAINVSFQPSVYGPQTGTLTVTDYANNSPQSATLSGTGLTPVVSLSALSLTFTAQALSTPSARQTITLANTGNGALTPLTIGVSGDFAETNTCAGSVAPNANCTLSVTFTPTGSGTRSGALTLTDNASNSPQMVTLSGTGLAPQTSLSPTSLTFGDQTVGTTSTAQTITLINPNNGGPGVPEVGTSGDFQQENVCDSLTGLTLDTPCPITVWFAPTTAGTRTGTLTVSYFGSTPMTLTANLTGTGELPSVGLSATSLNFPAQTVSTKSAPQTITVTAPANVPLAPLKITRSGPFAETNNCYGGVPPGESCTISVTFSPIGPGSQSGTMTLTDNAGTQTIALSGTGMDFAATSSTTTQTVSAGQAANYSLTLAPQGGFNQTVNLTCTGAPSESTCTLTPSTATLNGTASTTVAVAVTTTAPSTARLAPPAGRLLPPGFTGSARLFWLCGLLGLASVAALATARKRRAACLLAACLLLAMLWSACGGGLSTPLKTVPGTPAGTYTVAVTATSASTPTLTHTIQFTLTVN